MGRRRRTDIRIRGPWWDPEREQWRFEIVYPDGVREGRRCRDGSTEAEARDEADGWLATRRTQEAVCDVAGAVQAYRDYLSRQGDGDDTTRWVGCAAQALVTLAGNLPADRVTPVVLDRYLREISSLKLASQRSYWRCISRMCAWWKKRGIARRDAAAALRDQRVRMEEPFPWATKKGRRELGRGKPQLGGESALRRYLDAAMAQAEAVHRVAAVLPVLTGIASGELRHLTVRRVDFDGGALWIGDDDVAWSVKREDRRRSLPIPRGLEEDLRVLCAGKEPGDLVFGQDGRGGGDVGAPHHAQWLGAVVERVCKAAGIERVTPHGLRGTYSTLLFERKRRDIADVGLALGHADGGETARRHYVGGAEHRVELRVLPGGASDSPARSPAQASDAPDVAKK